MGRKNKYKNPDEASQKPCPGASGEPAASAAQRQQQPGTSGQTQFPSGPTGDQSAIKTKATAAPAKRVDSAQQQSKEQPSSQQPKEQAPAPQFRGPFPSQQSKEQGWGPQSREQPRGQQLQGQSSGKQSKEQPRSQQPQGQAWGPKEQGPRVQQPQGQSRGQQSREQPRGQPPKDQGWGQQSREQPRGQQSQGQSWGPKEQGPRVQQPQGQSRGQQSREQPRGQPPKDQGWGQQSRDQPRGQQPQAQSWGQQSREQPRGQPPKDQGWGQQSREQPHGQPPKDQGWGSQYREQSRDQQFKEKTTSPQKSAQSEKPPHEGRQQQASATRSESKMVVAASYGVNTKRGTRGRPFQLETNYVKLIIDKIAGLAYQYDIKFDPDKPKRFMRPAFEEYCRHVKLPCKIAYDGKSIVFSPRNLPSEYCRPVQLKVRDPESESNMVKDFTVTLTLTNDPEIQLNSLKTYHNTAIYDQPQRALQCVDVVLRSAFVNKGTRSGRSVYNKPDAFLDLQDGFEMWYGLFQSAVLGSQPFLNIDVCHRAFPSEIGVIDYCRKHFRNFDPKRQLGFGDKKALQFHLNGLKVVYEPPKCFNQSAKQYGFCKVLEASADNQDFVVEDGRKNTVANYFRERGYALQFPKLPCLHIGPRTRTIYIPMELCKIPGGQLSMKKAGQTQVRNLIRYAAVPTDERKRNIMKQFNRLQHNNDETIKAFGIQVGNNFIQINGRILDSPILLYENTEIQVRDGKWDSGRDNANFIIPSTIQFGVLIMDKYFSEKEGRDFGQKILQFGNFGNVKFERRFDVFKVNKEREQRTFEEYMLKFKRDFKADIVFVIISAFDYAKVKQWAELDHGVLTQCIKTQTVQQRLNQSTVQNILLKVNAKTNGFNHRISKSSQTAIMDNEDVMFIGADVTHPSPDQRDIPSVVGTAASHDLYGFKYNMQYRLQDPKKEMIDKMNDIMMVHLNAYKKYTNKLPKQIIYYRDGVSDGQLPQVKDLELRGFDAAFRQIYGNQPKPKLTCLIVQKRHHTRFFPPPRAGYGKFNNVRPGTIVDQDITHPNECQFFLVSHESIQGTAKPTKYVVIRDDNNYDIDDLQAITNNMCHMFTRCNRAVSYPAPAYYAHLVAARGRVYIEGGRINLRNLEREYKDRTIHSDIVNNYPMYFT